MAQPQDKSGGDSARAEAANTPPNDTAASAAGAPPPGSGETAATGAGEGAAAGKEGAASDLPQVEAPKLGSGETEVPAVAETLDARPMLDSMLLRPHRLGAEAPDEAAGNAQGSGNPPRSFRFALLAATIALAAGIGSFAGALTVSGTIHRAGAQPALPKTAEARDVVQAMKAQLAQLSAVKANLESATRSANAQYARLAERLDSLERAQADPAAKLAHIAEAVDRLEKQHPASAPSDITGSIGANPPQTAAAPAPATNVKPAVLNDWVVQDVRNGRAMVENRYGGMFLVGAGSMLPGIGRVEAVKRQDGLWVVVTASGLITSVR